MKVATVILAAGASTRLGEPKQLVLLGGERLLERAVRVAQEAGCEPIVVVLGELAERVIAECELRAARVVLNAGWAEGMASSIRLGVAAIANEADGTILMTCDQPAVTADHLRRLAAAGGYAPIASTYAGRNGVPAFFPAKSFKELERLRGDEGARRLLEGTEAIELAMGELDVDTPESLEAARAVFC